MSRPTRYCATCGEYVAGERPRLRHIDADGREIHRSHAPIEETDETRGASVNRLAQLRQERRI